LSEGVHPQGLHKGRDTASEMSKLTRNEITGDYLKSKVNTNKYRQNYDMIFHKKTGEVSEGLTGECYCTPDCECKQQKDSEGKI
jgi:hypothetical protein